jgi:hypothetical protein
MDCRTMRNYFVTETLAGEIATWYSAKKEGEAMAQ